MSGENIPKIRRASLPVRSCRRYNASVKTPGWSRRFPITRNCSTAVVLGVLLLRVPSAHSAAGTALFSDHRSVCIRSVCFDAEIALTAAERGRGLMYRETLAKDRGMLFVFPEEGLHRFWMKNTRIELDIVFITADRRVVSISRRARPCWKEPCDIYSPEGNVAYALEIAGGLADTYGLAAGNLVEFREISAGR